MSIKLLAMDLDGTVLGDDLIISDRMRSAIRRAQERGLIVTIATGRMFVSARKFAAALGIREPLVCYQGAMVRHSTTGNTLYHQTVPAAAAQRIIARTDELGLHLNLYMNDLIYTARITRHALFYSQINMNMPIHQVGDLGAWLAEQEEEPTKLVIITDPDETDEVLRLFTEEFAEQLQVTKSHARFTEFTNAECSKGRALAFLASHLGIAREEVMAIGDGLNDLDMIAWAGYGVAMGTAPQVVLDAAHMVCGPIADDGAAEIIERYVLDSAGDEQGDSQLWPN